MFFEGKRENIFFFLVLGFLVKKEFEKKLVVFFCKLVVVGCVR